MTVRRTIGYQHWAFSTSAFYDCRTFEELLLKLSLSDLDLHSLVDLLGVTPSMVGIVLDGRREQRVDKGGLSKARFAGDLWHSAPISPPVDGVEVYHDRESGSPLRDNLVPTNSVSWAFYLELWLRINAPLVGQLWCHVSLAVPAESFEQFMTLTLAMPISGANSVVSSEMPIGVAESDIACDIATDASSGYSELIENLRWDSEVSVRLNCNLVKLHGEF